MQTPYEGRQMSQQAWQGQSVFNAGLRSRVLYHLHPESVQTSKPPVSSTASQTLQSGARLQAQDHPRLSAFA